MPAIKKSPVIVKPTTSGILGQTIGKEQHVEETFPLTDHVVSGGIHSTK